MEVQIYTKESWVLEIYFSYYLNFFKVILQQNNNSTKPLAFLNPTNNLLVNVFLLTNSIINLCFSNKSEDSL